ncbi:MAG: BatA domain-containing protein [Bacteroidia bacterium]|nr:BatA domain-containing protein [Bacteroidia bacterium]
MSFANPTYLWTLLGLIVPIAIHLWSKKEGRTIQVGSLKFLKASDSSQSSSIKLNEYLLLLTRLLLLLTLTLILAEPQLKAKHQNVKLTYLVEPSLLLNAEFNSMIDTLESEEPIKLLQKDFPELGDYDLEDSAPTVPNYWQLAQDFKSLRSDSVIVFVEGFITGLKGMRPSVKNNIEWIQITSDKEINEPLQALLKKDSIELISAKSNAHILSFEKLRISKNHPQLQLDDSNANVSVTTNTSEYTLPVVQEDTLRIEMVHAIKTIKELELLEVSFKAISKHLNRPILIIKDTLYNPNKPKSSDLIVWLDKTLVEEYSGLQLIYSPNTYSNEIIEEGSSRHIYHLTKPLNTKTIVNYHLPEKLLEVLAIRSGLDEKIALMDKRIVSKNELIPNAMDTPDHSEAKMIPISKWFWAMLIILLIAERLFAKLRKQ